MMEQQSTSFSQEASPFIRQRRRAQCVVSMLAVLIITMWWLLAKPMDTDIRGVVATTTGALQLAPTAPASNDTSSKYGLRASSSSSSSSSSLVPIRTDWSSLDHTTDSVLSFTSEPTTDTTDFTVSLRPLQPLDREQYTVRINTWKRETELAISLSHYLTCSGVAQIQVVWCIAQGAPPVWLTEYPNDRVVVEAHANNSLNERFNVLLEPATLGILSVDEDVLRPCLAIDSGFFKWTANPTRMVGFDARMYTTTRRPGDDDSTSKWRYEFSDLSSPQRNQYSFTLTKFSLQHVDYMKSYMIQMPAVIRDTVAANLNCEDIAFSMWVSAATNGQVPLLADAWANTEAVIKLPSSSAISAKVGHKQTRDECVDAFSIQLRLKEKEERRPLQVVQHIHVHDEYGGEYERGAVGNTNNVVAGDGIKSVQRQIELQETVATWKQHGSCTRRKNELDELKRDIRRAVVQEIQLHMERTTHAVVAVEL